VLILGAPHRRSLLVLLQGNVVTRVAENLPETLQLAIPS
jgi:hypothetical protein